MFQTRSVFVPFLLFAVLALSACSDPNRELLNQKVQDAEARVADLGEALKAGNIRNAIILKEYGEILRKDRPELSTIVTSLEKEGTENGQQFKFLNTRLNELKKHTAQIGDPQRLLPEADSLVRAANPSTFNNALADPINVLADMSNGTLPRVGVVPKSEEATYNDVKDYGVGSQMIGNPAYGHWVNNGGLSFWEFYGMYSMFNNIFGSRHVYYSDWDRHRPYSYYQDVGIDRYGSYREQSQYRSSYSKGSGVTRSPTQSNKKSFGGDRKISSLSKGGGAQSSLGGGVAQRKGSSLSAGGGVTKRKPSALSRSGYSQRNSSGYTGSLRSSSTYSRSVSRGK
jgi:hypothetical protein